MPYIIRCLILMVAAMALSVSAFAEETTGMISGRVLSDAGEPVDYAMVFLKDTPHLSHTNEKGLYHIKAPAGGYTLVCSSVGLENTASARSICSPSTTCSTPSAATTRTCSQRRRPPTSLPR